MLFLWLSNTFPQKHLTVFDTTADQEENGIWTINSSVNGQPALPTVTIMVIFALVYSYNPVANHVPNLKFRLLFINML